MAAPKKAVPPSADAAPEPVTLARASESGDPAVHQLLAHRQTAQMNGDEAAVAAVDAQLAALGYC